jgi:hypothetical protein
MMPHQGSWEEFRAVCWDHPQEKDEVIAPWMAHDTQKLWINAKLDAVAHDLEEHPRLHEWLGLFPERKSDG